MINRIISTQAVLVMTAFQHILQEEELVGEGEAGQGGEAEAKALSFIRLETHYIPYHPFDRIQSQGSSIRSPCCFRSHQHIVNRSQWVLGRADPMAHKGLCSRKQKQTGPLPAT